MGNIVIIMREETGEFTDVTGEDVTPLLKVLDDYLSVY